MLRRLHRCITAVVLVAAVCLPATARVHTTTRRRAGDNQGLHPKTRTAVATATGTGHCVPRLTTGRTLPRDFVAASKQLPRLQYADAIQGTGRVRLWTKLATNTQLDTALAHPRMQPETRRTYCASQAQFYPEFQPRHACNGTFLGPVYGAPWCWPASDPAHIFSVDCAILDNYGSHPDVGFTVVTDEYVVATNRGRWNLSADVVVQEFDKLAVVPAAEYPSAPGHFLNEILPALLFMDQHLPLDVPLLWPASDYNAHILESLQTERVLSSRPITLAGPQGTHAHMRVGKLYMFRTNRDWHSLPHVSWLAQNVMKASLVPVLHRLSGRTNLTPSKTAVTVLRRSGGRSLTNHDDLVQAVRDELPGAVVHTFEPGLKNGYPFWKTAATLFDSCLVIGPHGANMNNVLFMRPGCWVIEIGFVDATFSLPSDFFCAARNMGLTYWLSLATGGYTSELTANIEEIRSVLRLYADTV